MKAFTERSFREVRSCHFGSVGLAEDQGQGSALSIILWQVERYVICCPTVNCRLHCIHERSLTN